MNSIIMIVICVVAGFVVGELIRIIMRRAKGEKYVPNHAARLSKPSNNYSEKLKASRATKKKKKR